MSERFDAIVLGAGPAGEVAVTGLLDGGMRVALVERELIGGECSNWACIPTKTLLRATEVVAEAARVAGVSRPTVDFERVAAYRDYMVSNLDDGGRVAGYERRGVAVVKERGRLAGRGRVETDGGRVLEAPHVVVSTGSDPVIPPVVGLAEAGFWTNREATELRTIPKSAVLVGGGPVGLELAQFLARMGARVGVVQSADRLLDRESPELCAYLQRSFERDGIEVALNARATSVRREGSVRVVTLADGRELAGEVVVVATGRRPRTRDIGLETVGIDGFERGIPVDEHMRAGEGVWAVGDCTGILMFTHVGKYQARVAAADILARPARADYRAVPRVVFTDPEVAAVGLTEEQARERGLDVVSASIRLERAIARPFTYEEEPSGGFGVVADRERQVLVGAWAAAPLASEWIHQAVLAIRAEVPLAVLRDTMAQFPTFSEAYGSALRALPADAPMAHTTHAAGVA